MGDLMRAGKLKHALMIEREVKAVDAAGYVTSTWMLIGTIRAELAQQATTEGATGYGEAGTAGLTFKTRYLTGLTTADRIRYLGRAYNLKSITDFGPRGGLELTVDALE
ncbi:head-tail adaptor [Rhizobium sp. SG_E_25_P2]|uniref:head-tail adaptor protein n=1 Tax=Rhizobium sp. SG_E_25_P2 TaxID=2879942 RepID=UPI002476994D|nr:head-tail adaptor protein [Rhizobium sp. SG_E_25_P2]MDH6265644.1 head-tail adaptor [Rhizobium sp. SG_E_25_P2]